MERKGVARSCAVGFDTSEDSGELFALCMRDGAPGCIGQLNGE